MFAIDIALKLAAMPPVAHVAGQANYTGMHESNLSADHHHKVHSRVSNNYEAVITVLKEASHAS